MHVRLSVYATLALVFGPILFLRAFRAFRTREVIRDTPTARIRSMAMGLVEIHGDVVERSHHTAPFSGRPCAYWELDIATRARRGWSIVHRDSSGSPFFVRDDTGLALVFPRGAECHVRHQVEEQCFGVNVPEPYNHYLDEHKLGFAHIWRLSTLRFRERILDEGQRIYVLGTAMPQAQVLEVNQDVALVATGTEGARADRLRELHEHVAGIVRRGDNEKVFIISEESERELLLDFGLKAWGGLIAGPILTLFALGYWLLFVSSRGFTQ